MKLDDIKYTQFRKAEVFVVDCPSCGFYHLFFFGQTGTVVHLTQGNHRDTGNLAKECETTTQEIKKNGIFICKCGMPIKIL